MTIKYFACLIMLFLPSIFFVAGQTGPSQTGQNSLSIFTGSGKNQILIAEVAPDVVQISVSSGDATKLAVHKIDFTKGNTFALVEVEEKGMLGNVDLLIGFDNGSAVVERTLTIHVVNYDNSGLNFEIHDIVFWQEAIPLAGMSVFDTIIQSGQGPYESLKYDRIPLTVNLDCTALACTGNDFYTAFYRGYVIPPVDGTYHFYMQGPDRFALWMSTHENFSGAQMIAGRTNNRGDAGTDVGNNTRKSAPRVLQGGKVYAIYAAQWIIHATYGGIMWDGPGFGMEYIPGEHLMLIYDTQKPTTPGNLKLDWKATNQIQVSWNPSVDNNKVAGYNLYINGIRYNDQIIENTGIKVVDLVPATQYQIVVTAVDRVLNESFVSNQLNVETFPEDNSPPLPPIALEVLKVTGLAAHIKWTGASDAETEVIAYNVYVDGALYNPGGFIFGDNFIIHNLVPKTEYWITIESVDASFNVSALSEPFKIVTSDFNPLDEGLGEKRGTLIVKDKNISWNHGFGLNVPYENGSYPNNVVVRDIVREFGAGAVRWGAITANSRSFAGSTGTNPSHNNTYARLMNHANEIGAFFALTVGVDTHMDYMQDPNTFLRLMEYLNGPAETAGGARRAAEGFTEPLLPNSPGVLLEFGNEVWGAAVHNSPIGSNYENYAAWVRDMSDVVRSSPYYDPEKIIMVYSGRYPHPSSSYHVNTRVLTGDRGHVENLAVSGYLGGNLNYDPEIPAGDSELDYYKNGVAMARYNMDGFVLTMKEMLSLTGTLKTFYLYETNMTTPSYNGRFGQAIVMTDYLASGMLYGLIVPSIFHLTGGQWRITRPTEDYKRLPLFTTGRYFNRFCKGHILKTSFVTNNQIRNSSGQIVNWEPVGGYAYNRGEDFSLLLINRDFEDAYTVQIELPASLEIDANAMMYTIWNDDFSSIETNIDSTSVSLSSGMLITVPKHAMVIIAARGKDPEYTRLPHGHFDRIRVDSLDTYTDGGYEITTNRGAINLYGIAFPEDAFSRDIKFEVLENDPNAEITHFSTGNYLRVRGFGVCGYNGIVKIKVIPVDNHALADTVTIQITNQGINCNVSAENLSDDDFFLFYPNPVNARLVLNKYISADATFELYDISGRKVLQQPLKLGYEIRVDDLLSGVYLIRVVTPGGKVLQGKLNKN